MFLSFAKDLPPTTLFSVQLISQRKNKNFGGLTIVKFYILFDAVIVQQLEILEVKNGMVIYQGLLKTFWVLQNNLQYFLLSVSYVWQKCNFHAKKIKKNQTHLLP